MIEPVLTAGGLIVAALVSTVGLILVAKINTVGTKVDTAIDLSKPTGNGFSKQVTGDLEALKRSNGALHRRLDQMADIIVNFDGRLTQLEDCNDEQDNPPAPHVPQGHHRRSGDGGVGDRNGVPRRQREQH